MNNEMTSNSILEKWNSIKTQLEYFFRKRDQENTEILMKQGISLFIQFLSSVNEMVFQEGQEIPYQNMSFKPVNLEERLGFIISRPKLYHSYRQLSELMVELEKLSAKKEIKKKSSSYKS
ncbi:YpoC family protein [Neobacillus mesonae]|uniref:YpoC family protein n=1 Tax=Neobacillus mesonae TaxID=1193713 RepID=UPI00203DE5E2|nr:hypothetical protein [Neobacillus mesonae]MCM3566822.1 hypothetical protein [Neobacillus mesonae]